MSGDIRDLLTHARDSFDTIHLDVEAEYNGPLLHLAFRRSIPNFDALVKSGAIVTFEMRVPRKAKAAKDEDPWFRHDWRVWWRKPSFWRDDIVWEGNAGVQAVHIVRDAAASVHVPQLRRLYTNQPPERKEGLISRLRSRFARKSHFELPTVESRLRETVLMDPLFIAPWELTVLGDRVHAGRKAVYVRATRLRRESRLPLWDQVDQYEVLVDAERGILLRYAGFVDGVEAGVLSVREVRFDEPILDEVFSEQVPQGTRIVVE